MALVDSTTTEAQLRGLYLDNMGYIEADSAPMAGRLITIMMAPLWRAITKIESPEGGEMEFSPAEQRKMIADARAFIASKNAGSVSHADIRNYRG